MPANFDLTVFIVSLVVTVLSITLHEFGHAISADKLGDDTPRREGRITLWPDKHFDPFGFFMIVFTSLAGRGLGWGKPVMVQPRHFRSPRRDMVIVAVCGPVMNLALALFFGLILRVIFMTHLESWVYRADGEFSRTFYGQFTLTGLFLIMFVTRNLGLMFFNLIPVHPLDGSKILSGLLPLNMSINYDRFIGQYGPMLLLGLCFLGPQVIGQVVSPAVDSAYRLIVGVPLY